MGRLEHPSSHRERERERERERCLLCKLPRVGSCGDGDWRGEAVHMLGDDMERAAHIPILLATVKRITSILVYGDSGKRCSFQMFMIFRLQ